MTILVAYATTDGMTTRIAERIADAARSAGSAADVVDVAALPRNFDPKAYDGVILAASMHAKGYQRAATRFVLRYEEALRTRPTGFVSVCLSILSKDAEERRRSRQLAEQFPAQRGWKPDVIEVVAGALMFSRYGFLRRMVMKHIAQKEMGPTTTTHDIIFTDWAAVDRFADDFVRRLVHRAVDEPREARHA